MSSHIMKPSSFFLLLLSLLGLQVSAAPLAALEPTNSTLEARQPPYNPSAPRRGLPFNNAKYIQNFCGTQVSWAYNWDSAMPDNFPGCLEYVPMLWGTASEHTDPWFNNVNNALSRGSYRLLAFNEPDKCGTGQSCIDPETAASAYRQYIQPFAGRAWLGTPAVTNGPNGLSWLQEFLNLCNDCQINMVVIHWYDSATNIAYFQNYINEALAIANGKGLWITEMHGSGSTQQQQSFLQTVMPWMDHQFLISNYAWFMADPNPGVDAPLANLDGSLTALGQTFAHTGF